MMREARTKSIWGGIVLYSVLHHLYIFAYTVNLSKRHITLVTFNVKL
jgi:hypothetical protein